MAKKKIHGEDLLRFEASSGTLRDFIECFRLGKRRALLSMKQDLFVEVGELLFDKEDYIVRTVTIGKVTQSFRFPKHQKAIKEDTESASLINAMRNIKHVN